MEFSIRSLQPYSETLNESKKICQTLIHQLATCVHFIIGCILILLIAVASSLMATVKKIFNGPSLKHQSETVMSTSRVAVSISIYYIPTVWNIVKVQIPVMSNSIVVLGHQLTLYVIFKLHIAAKLFMDSMLLGSAHSVVTMAAHFMST